jgi:manganese/iron transport system permease protein
VLLEPFGYGYMVNAMWVSALVGGVCAFLSAYLMLKGWSLIGDALSHAIVPGVAGAYMLGLPFALGAFFSAGWRRRHAVPQPAHQAARGRDHRLIFTSFFGARPVHDLAVADLGEHPDHRARQHPRHHAEDTLQLVDHRRCRSPCCWLKWKDLMVDLLRREPCALDRAQPGAAEDRVLHAAQRLHGGGALQTVGAFLVIAMVVTPGATAYLLTDRFRG